MEDFLSFRELVVNNQRIVAKQFTGEDDTLETEGDDEEELDDVSAARNTDIELTLAKDDDENDYGSNVSIESERSLQLSGGGGDHTENETFDQHRRVIVKQNDENNFYVVLPTEEQPPDEEIQLLPTNEIVLNKTVKRESSRISRNTAVEQSDEEVSGSQQLHGKVKKEGRSAKEMDDFIRENIQLVCDICSDSDFLTFVQLKNHFLTEHNPTIAYVKCCSIKFDRRWKLYDHIQFHLNPDMFKCDSCDKNFNSKKNLEAHEKMVHLEPTFQCDKCERKFGTKFQLKQHQPSHLTDEEKRFICPICRKPFPAKFNLTMHVNAIHKNLRPFVCEVCPSSFLTGVNLREHMLTHETDRPRIECSHCNKLFATEISLKKHMQRVLTSGETHRCSICEHESPNLSSLKDHITRNHKNKPKSFKCPYCNKTFKSNLTLKEHKASHTGGRLYKCPFCPKEFNSSANMYSHRKKKHPVDWAKLQKTTLGQDLS